MRSRHTITVINYLQLIVKSFVVVIQERTEKVDDGEKEPNSWDKKRMRKWITLLHIITKWLLQEKERERGDSWAEYYITLYK